MDYYLKSRQSASPCVVTNDEDSGIYCIRKEDTSGEVFNSKQELIKWIEDNWVASDFEEPGLYSKMMKSLETECNI